MYQLFMKLANGEKLSLAVNMDWTVAELKAAINGELGLGLGGLGRRKHPATPDSPNGTGDVSDQGVGKPNVIRVIFAGVELLDMLNIKDYEIPDGSLIHIVIDRTDLSDEGSNQTNVKKNHSSLESSFTDLEITSTPIEVQTDTEISQELKRKPCFYVYCKDPCGMVTKGKLRVCCQICKKGAFTVLQDLTCWEDVLIPGKILGCCRSYNCSGDKSEFYFKCANHQTIEDDRVPALPLIKTNTKDVTCLACECVFDPVLVFPCDSGHVICLQCFKLYCQTKLNERQFIQHNQIGYSLSCPAGCENSLIQETHHFRILGSEEYNKYQSFATEECVLQNGGVLCPAPGCGTAIFTDEGVQRVTCLQRGDIGCGFVFCRDCKLSYHNGECTNTGHDLAQEMSGYHVDMNRVERARWDLASRSTIQATTKPCPRCKVPVEKSGGCMHMKCTRVNCKFEWCWLCCVEWNNDCMALHWFGEEPFFL